MTTIRPFRGLRPATAALAREIASLPYDVMNTEEARAELAKHPDSFIAVTKSEATLPPGIAPNDAAVYARARENLVRLVREGKLVQDARDCYYIYRQQMGPHIQIGLVACCDTEEYKCGVIKRHELTRAEKEQDRVDHIRITRAQTGPVFLTFRMTGSVLSHLMRLMGEKAPVYAFVADDGVQHSLYVVDSAVEIRGLTQELAAIPALYIADGHHRCAGATRVAAEVAVDPDGAEARYFQAVIFPDKMLTILDYNRVVVDLNGYTPQTLLKAMQDKFEVQPVAQPVKPHARHRFGMYLAGQWYKLTAKDGTFDAKDPIGALDVSILQQNLLAPLLGIGDPRTDARIDFVGGIRGLKELQGRVDSGEMAVAFSMYPTPMADVEAVADAGLIMPPKSTWFEPKLRDGLVVHLLQDINPKDEAQPSLF